MLTRPKNEFAKLSLSIEIHDYAHTAGTTSIDVHLLIALNLLKPLGSLPESELEA